VIHFAAENGPYFRVRNGRYLHDAGDHAAARHPNYNLVDLGIELGAYSSNGFSDFRWIEHSIGVYGAGGRWHTGYCLQLGCAARNADICASDFVGGNLNSNKRAMFHRTYLSSGCLPGERNTIHRSRTGIAPWLVPRIRLCC
jgi:hypothetical protein